MLKNKFSQDSKRFFKFWREQYEWPIGVGRKASEQKIFELLNETRNAISSGESRCIQEILVEIHRWKTNNQRGVSERYETVLTDDTKVVPFLRSNFPLKSSSLSPTFFKELAGSEGKK